MNGMELFGVAIVPLIIGIIQVFKRAGLDSRYAGVVAWIIGVAVGLAYGLTEAGWSLVESVIMGSALGLSAAGVYSSQKSMRRAKYKLHGSDK